MKHSHSEPNKAPARTLPPPNDEPDGFYHRKLKQGLGSIVAALDDIEIQRKVEKHFRDNPQLSRTAEEVVAVACQLKKAKVLAARLVEDHSGPEGKSLVSCSGEPRRAWAIREAPLNRPVDAGNNGFLLSSDP